MSDDLRATVLIDQINALEARLDLRPSKRRRFWGVLGVLALFASAAVFDWNLLHPLVLIMLAINGPNLLLNLLHPVLQRRYVHRERERLIEQHEKIIALAEQRLATPGSPRALDPFDDEPS